MANNKDFLLKNAVEVGGPTNVTLGTVTNNNIDLSTGNYFVDTPSGTSTYTFSNAGDVQSFQVEVTGGVEEVASNFSTTLYTGTSATQTVTNGIDLATDGGLVWIKRRDDAQSHWLFDSERDNFNNKLTTDSTSAEVAVSSYPYDLDPASSGFTVNGAASNTNLSGATYASWTFKKAAGFCDIVTYTGDGQDNRAISHNLGADIGTIIVKSTSHLSNWVVWHRNFTQSGNSSQFIYLNSTGAVTSDTNIFAGFSSTTFTVGGNGGGGGDPYTHVNTNGRTYVAYLFAHDAASDGLIQCGSYTGTGSNGNAVTLGWEPQWLMVKRTDAIGGWIMVDAQRGMATGADPSLFADASNAEDSQDDWVDATSTGFSLNGSFYFSNASGGTYIYIAIRKASALDLTWPTSIEWAGGVAPAAPASGETDLFTFSTDDGGTSYIGLKTADALS